MRLAESYSLSVRSVCSSSPRACQVRVLVGALHRVGEKGEGDGSEAAEAAKYVPFIGSGRPLLPLHVV